MRLLLAFLAVLLFPFLSHALQEVSPSEGKTVFVNVSSKDLNVIRTPFRQVKALTGNEGIDVRVEGGNVFVKFTGPASPSELIIQTEDGDVYPLILVPQGIPSEVINLNPEKETKETREEAKSGVATAEHLSSIKALVKAMYLGTSLRGYTIKNLNEDRRRWNELKCTLKRIYTGRVLTGEVYELEAVADVVLEEREFYEDGVYAICLETHSLKAGERTRLFVVRSR